jgi:hypothetical protein
LISAYDQPTHVFQSQRVGKNELVGPAPRKLAVWGP